MAALGEDLPPVDLVELAQVLLELLVLRLEGPFIGVGVGLLGVPVRLGRGGRGLRARSSTGRRSTAFTRRTT
ncbi:hypothetical protein AB0I99_12985 [Streptomyces spongiicola]|uniref:Uncharacterized protein n=1 Tax=Streptomyces spongiicola TaxID=1690221 RepID=A0ABM6V7E6_9ACTN|nr:hypothetical protein [Streptomyces spongiicola]AWK09936.1 hypothetical protein DDQ41_14610 [Streptomyces spongiicola]